LILAAAGELFVRDGYPHVSMRDIAEAMAVRPSALYRHFPGKQELLREVVLASFTAFHTALDQARRQADEDPLRTFALTVLDHRRLGVLWQREARHLTPDAHRELRGELNTIAELLTAHIHTRRTDLEPGQDEVLAWAVLSALVSVSFQRINLPRQHYDQLLIAIMTRIMTAELPPPGQRHPPTNPLPTAPALSRRDQLITEATRLFADNGYRGVGIEEIAAATGIAGPSIYHHFTSKSELMNAVLQPGAQFLPQDLDRVLAGTDHPVEALRELLGTYIAFGLTNPHLLQLLVIEIAEEPDEWRHIRRIERDYVAHWSQLLRRLHPNLGPDDATVQVQAVMNIVNDLARTRHLALEPALADTIHALGSAVLGLTPHRP
jgi:AcrR family transcriptional regulator